MKLIQDPLAQFGREGCLFFPSHFSAGEVRVLADKVPLPWKNGTPAEAPQGALKAA